MAHTTLSQEWEYTVFSYKNWLPGETWSSLGDPRADASSIARAFFWEKAESRIHAAMGSFINLGWQTESPIGPHNIRIHRSLKIDAKYSAADVLLWFMTFGIALVFQLFLNTPRYYIIYQPVECRVRLRREKVPQAIKVAA